MFSNVILKLIFKYFQKQGASNFVCVKNKNVQNYFDQKVPQKTVKVIYLKRVY